MIRANTIWVNAGGRWVLSGLSLDVPDGQVALVTGANGAGKSVLARALAGLEPLSDGQVLVGGADIRRRRVRRTVGYLPQQSGFYADLTVAENLGFFAGVAGVPWRQRRKACADLLELVGLAGAGALPASALTPGQRQRLAIARALAGNPGALVLDEPLTGLDAEGRADVRHLIGELAALGKALVVITGEPDAIPHDRHCVLSGGILKGGEVA